MKKFFLILIILSLLFLTACWDMEEINRRAFVSSIGMDLNKTSGLDKYVVTYIYPNINAIGKSATEDKKKFIIVVPSSSMFQAGRSASVHQEFPFYYKHLKVLMIGEELAENEKLMRQLIDELNRDTKINKKIQILVAKGEAKEVLGSKSNVIHEDIEAIYNILKDNRSASRFTPQTLTGMIKELDYNNVALVPSVESKGKKVSISGGAIIKDYKLIGRLNTIENRSVAFLKNVVKTELVEVEYKERLLSYNITNSKCHKSIKIDGDVNVDISLNIEGYLQGYTVRDDINVYDSKVLEEMEKVIEKQLEKEIKDVLELSQKKYNADLIGIGGHLSKYEPSAWDKIKGKWDEIYPEIRFNVSVNAKIRGTGLIK